MASICSAQLSMPATTTAGRYIVSGVFRLACTGLAELGRTSEAATAIERGFAAAADGKEQWYVPELHRIRGELLLKPGGDSSRALGCFETALDLAGKQGALSWQLRGRH
jgi:hypothetical protein